MNRREFIKNVTYLLGGTILLANETLMTKSLNTHNDPKLLLIMPPKTYPSIIDLPVPLLIGQLRNHGYDAKGLDLNIELYNDMCNSKQIAQKIQILKDQQYNSAKIPQNILNIINNKSKVKHLLDNIDNSATILKSPLDLYDIKAKNNALDIIENALSIMEVDDSSNIDFFKANIDSKLNLYYDYFLKKMPTLSLHQYDFIGISVTYPQQLLPALTLASILKKTTKAHICIGGASTFTMPKQQQEELLDNFCDSLIVGYGEHSIVSLMTYLYGNASSQIVKGLATNKNSSKIFNQSDTITTFSDIKKIDLTGYNLKQSFIHKNVISMELSKGCPWGKCSFCNFPYKRKYCAKSIEQAVSEMKYIKNKYSISAFALTDSAIPSIYYNELADAIIREKLDVTLYSNARLEEGFCNEQLLNKLHRAGVRALQWGYESASERICNLMNKNVNFDKREKILEMTHKAGIANLIFIMFNFPSETEQEADMTIHFLKKYKNIITLPIISYFGVSEHSPIYNHPERFGINMNNLPDNHEKTQRIESKLAKLGINRNDCTYFSYLGLL